MRYPVNAPYRVTLKYGATSPPYSSSRPHNGTDLVSDDKQVVAPEGGTITYAQNTGGNSGYMIVLSGTHRHSFSHIRVGGIRVSVGQRVSEGQLLGIMGETGLAFGIHVHWVVDGGSVNPESLITEGEPMFNEGDRKNINVYIYGEDRLKFVGAVGMPWKEAMYGIFGSDEFKVDQFVNPGDVSNINKTLNRDDAKSTEGKTWKDTGYGYFLKVIPPSPQSLAKGIYEVK